jgi:hypothetical protein
VGGTFLLSAFSLTHYLMMAEAQEADEIFVHMGGDQVVPLNVMRVRIDKSVKIIPEGAFQYCSRLSYVEFHDGIERIERYAFHDCGGYCFMRSIRLLGVKVIEREAFASSSLVDVEFGDKLETLQEWAFSNSSLRSITMPSVRTIGRSAFMGCEWLEDLELPEGLETLNEYYMLSITANV